MKIIRHLTPSGPAHAARQPDRTAHQIAGDLLGSRVLAGLGVAPLSAYLVDDEIRTGKLTRLLQEYSLPDREFRIVYSNRKFLPLKVKAFIDMAVAHFREPAESAPISEGSGTFETAAPC